MKKLFSLLMGFTFLAGTPLFLFAQSAREATIEPETKTRIVLQTRLSSKLNEVGDPVIATLEDAIYVNGELVIAKGTEFRGKVTHVKAAKRGHKEGELGLIFERIGMPWGEEPISIMLTTVDDWDNNDKLKANDEGQVKGGKRGDKTLDNVIRGSQVGAMGAGVIILSGGGGAAGAGALGAGALGGLIMTKGAEVNLQSGTILRIKFVKPLTLPVRSSAKPTSDNFDRPAVKNN
ncbi:MAG: hypothetical protein AB1757_19690 [Acidobacteriota bacterium]